MKTLATLVFVLLIGFSAKAQDAQNETKVVTIEMGVVLTETFRTNISFEENSVARLYKFKNSSIKSALSFKAKGNKAKLA